ncbi:hypothetical protein B566_EDAN008144 [Ephemera danica]|nr:hypothetical protein B566_EDAN008144 [Ephemera danica]
MSEAQNNSQNMELDDHITKRYDIKKRLGKGAYGIVWKAVDRKTKEIVALKKIFDAFQNQVDAQRTYREIMFLKAFGDHPNVIKLRGVHKACNNKDIYLVFDYMDTDLHKVIQNKNILKDIHKRFIMFQLLRATMYMHSGNVIHRDQKPSNILLDANCKCKIADFGLARSLHQLPEFADGTGDPPLTDYVATRWYRAPEILIGSTRYTKGIDMWSLGCILAEMLLERPLFPGGSSIKQFELIMRTLPQPSPEDMRMMISVYGGSKWFSHQSHGRSQSLREILVGSPPDAIDLVEQLLVLNPQQRLTASEALKHPYVARFHNVETEMCLQQSVMPPLSDNTMLSVEEYRSKLYELAATPSSRKNSQKHVVSEASTLTAVTTSAATTSTAAVKREKVKPKHTSSLEEKTNKVLKTKNTLAPPAAEWQDRRASLPKRMSQDRADSQSAVVKAPAVRIHAAPLRKASLPLLPHANMRSPQPASQQAPVVERAKLVKLSHGAQKIPGQLKNYCCRRQFGNKNNKSFWGLPDTFSDVCKVNNDSATIKFSLQQLSEVICRN